MMIKICKISGTKFEFLEQDRKFLDSVSPIVSDQVLKFNEPTLCPVERERRRLAYRNERKLYRRKSSISGKNIISVYGVDAPFPVYENSEWWSDKFDPFEYGRDFDFSRPFFEQFLELQNEVPRLALFGVRNQNSDFVNQETDDKNCYMNMGGHFNEDSYYCTYSIHSKNTVDCFWVLDSENLYECIVCEKCYNSAFLENCDNCSDSYFLKDCIGLKNCFGCIGLRHKEFYYFNEQLTREEYNEKIKLHLKGFESIERVKKEVAKHYLKYPHRFAEIINCEESTGSYLKNCKNSINCFDSENLHDCKNMYISLDMKDCQDISSIGWAEKIYECASSINLYNSAFLTQCVSDVSDSYYGQLLASCRHTFGCVGVKRGEYIILNKKYSKDEYEKLVTKIVEQMIQDRLWGEFFSAELSPFPYNETLAYDYFPLSEEVAREQGLKWKSKNQKYKNIEANYPPPRLNDITDEVTQQVFNCVDTGQSFKINQQELSFYRKMNLPLPDRCPDRRHELRVKKNRPKKLWQRHCASCGQNIWTSSSIENSELIYCDNCYKKRFF